jgi:poly-gamma-glutamate synthesis protein (capsule biosynthesis protein)
LRIAFVGDVMIGGEFLPYAEKRNLALDKPFEKVMSQIVGADIVVANLEGPLNSNGSPRQDVTALLSNHRAVVDIFKTCKNVVFNLGNNHIMDYGLEGLKRTVEVLGESGINHVGVGNNIEEATRELILNVSQKKIAFLSLTSDEPHIKSILGTKDSAGCASYLQSETILKKIKNLKKQVDIICLLLHWGHEFYSFPSFEQVGIARELIDSGVNLIVGGHPHVIQGLECYQGAPIAYSLGNFFMPPFRFSNGRPNILTDREREFLIMNAEIADDFLISYNLVLGSLDKNYNLIVEKNQEKTNRKIETLSVPLNLDDYQNFWKDYVIAHQKKLQRRSLTVALKKASKLRLKDLQSLGLDDVRRQFDRLKRIL